MYLWISSLSIDPGIWGFLIFCIVLMIPFIVALGLVFVVAILMSNDEQKYQNWLATLPYDKRMEIEYGNRRLLPFAFWAITHW